MQRLSIHSDIKARMVIYPSRSHRYPKISEERPSENLYEIQYQIAKCNRGHTLLLVKSGDNHKLILGTECREEIQES